MGKFDRPPSAAGYAEFQNGMPLERLASEGTEEALAREEHNRRLLRPTLDFLVLAAPLLLWNMWWNLAEEQCWNPSSYKATELTLLRVTRGVWIAWLTHAAGLLDEALRVFLGIRLTMGLGSPTSVDKTYTKMSRRAEIVAEGIAVDDFPALAGLYAGAEAPGANRRSSSGTSLRGGGGGGIGRDDGTIGWAGRAASTARVNKSLVMRVEKIAATAQLWSLVPWSDVRRYDRVHVKGITLRLRQVNGILNFSFLALKKGRRGGVVVGVGGDASGFPDARAGGGAGSSGGADVASGGRRNSGVGRGAGGLERFVGAGAPGQATSRSIEDLDGIDTDGEDTMDSDELLDEEEEEEEEDDACYEVVDDDADLFGAVGCGGGVDGEHTPESSRQRARSSSSSTGAADKASLRLQSVTTSGPLGGGARGTLAPWASASAANPTATGRSARPSHPGSVGPDGSHAPGERARSKSLSARAKKKLPQQSSSENLGNLGVLKVLGEAFMRRFNAYSEQVSAAFDRVSDIKVVPKLWRWGKKRGPKRRKRFEVGEILLEDVCICVDSGVWNDLLGDQVGAAFSPEFRLSVKVGPKELLTPNGKGRLANDIGSLVNDKLVRLLSRLVMRETLKTTTLTSVVIASLALDTDARGRQQGKLNKSLSPTPMDARGSGGGERSAFVRRGAPASGDEVADVHASAASVAATAENKPGKFWRAFATHSSPSSAAAAAAAEAGAAAGGSSSGFGTAGLPRSNSGGNMGLRSHSKGASGLRRRKTQHPPSSNGSSRQSSWNGFQRDIGGTVLDPGESGGGSGVGGRRQPTQRSKRSLPVIGPWRRSSEPPSSGPLLTRKVSLSPSPPPRPRSHVRQRPGPAASGVETFGSGAFADGDEDERYEERYEERRDGATSRLPGGGRSALRERDSTCSDVGVSGVGGVEDGELEKVAQVPPWMEGVEASAEYDEIKPTLDVIKRTVLLAMLQQTNRSVDHSTEFSEQQQGDANAGRSVMSWCRRHPPRSRSDEAMLKVEDRHLETAMQQEIVAAKEAGGDVDRLVMKRLLEGVRDSGPDTAYKALASIELSSFIDNLSNGTRFAQHLDHVGIDVKRLSRSLTGVTAGGVMEGFAGKVGDEARRLRTEATRLQKELLDEILPLLNDNGGSKDATSFASAFALLSDVLAGEHSTGGGGGGGGNPFPQHKDSWERGVSVPNDPEEEGHSVESGLRSVGVGVGDVEEVDQVDVIMQVMDLLDAVERLKKSVMEGGVSLGKVEQAVGKVAESIDIYLILAASESMLGFLLERLGKLPVGHARFSGKGVEARVGNLDLRGVHVKRENVDLVMKGFRLPKRGTPVMTRFGPGKIKRYKKRSGCFVVNLDWTLRSGKPVKAYLQPNDIEVLEGHEGQLSDEEEFKEGGHTKITTDSSVADATAIASDGPDRIKSGNANGGDGGGDSSLAPTTPREHTTTCSNSSSTPCLPPRLERGARWPTLSKMWHRRKSMGTAQAVVAEAGPTAFEFWEGEGGERAVAASGPGVSASDGNVAGRPVVGRTKSAPVLLGGSTTFSSSSSTATTSSSSTARALQGEGWAGLGNLELAAAAATESLGEASHSGIVGEAGRARTSSCSSGASAGTTTSTHSRKTLPGRVDVDNAAVVGDGKDGKARHRRQRSPSKGLITSPNSVDVMSAPFLVARISGVGAELKDIMWAVKQTHFPYLKTQGSLQATLSGLTVELELDTHDLPAGQGESRQVGGGDTGSGNDGGSGGRPTGLKLARLRVSVLAVKVHVKNNALSAVYNLAASAFEAAVKRYVVDNVEAVVRRNITSLLTIINTHLVEKWDVLCKVGGGGGGSSSGGEARISPRSGSAVEKILAASLSHHLVWPDGSGNGTATPAAAAKSVPVSDPPLPGQQGPHVERTGSGSSMGSGDGEDSGSVSAGSGGGTAASSVRKKLGKRSFRILGSVGTTPSTEDMSKLSSSSSSSSLTSPLSSAAEKAGSSSVQPRVSRIAHSARPPPPRSPPSLSQNSSSTTLSEGGGSVGASPVTALHRRDHTRSAPSLARGLSVSPLREQLLLQQRANEGLTGIGQDEGGVFFSDGFVRRRQAGQEEEEEYWTPPSSARLARGSIWGVDS